MKPRNHAFTPFQLHRLHAPRAIRALLLAGLLALPPLAAGAPVDLSETPISGASSTEIKPNILFIMDDSFSMSWEYLPDWAGVNPVEFPYQRFNPDFNGVAYNPAVTYVPPSYFNAAGAADDTTYPAQTAEATNNWTAVKKDGYGVQTTDTQDLTQGTNFLNSAFYYTVTPGEFCTDRTLKNCTTTQDAEHPVPAKLRWCNTQANATAATPAAGSCQAIMIDTIEGTAITYKFRRIPAPRISTLSLTGVGSVASIKVNGKNILSEGVVAPATMSDIVARINACTYKLVGDCEVAGFSAKLDSATLATLTAPFVLPAGTVPSVVPTGVLTTYQLSKPSTNYAPGENSITVITPGRATYPKAPSRTDCEGTVCTYAEEMTNYANWYAYYRTRMQAMKTAASRSFQPIDSKYRIGYFTINNGTGTDFQNISDFNGEQKKNWYDKLFSAKPVGDTPLRIALANAGRLYAGKLSTLNGVTVVDPMQYYCQPDVAILSTDGYWNLGPGKMLNGSTNVGDQDGPEVRPGEEIRPYLDGGAGILMQRTLQWQKRIVPTLATWHQKKTEQWQTRTMKWQQQTVDKPVWRTSQLQSKKSQRYTRSYELRRRVNLAYWTPLGYKPIERTRQLHKRTGTLQSSTWQLQRQEKNVIKAHTSHLQTQNGTRKMRTNQLRRRVTPLSQSNDYGMTWNPVEQCREDRSGTVMCRAEATTAWENVSSCTTKGGNPVKSGAGTDNEATTYYEKVECGYAGWTGWSNVSTCTKVAQSGGSPYTVGLAVDCTTTLTESAWTDVDTCAVDEAAGVSCRYAPWSAWVPVASCTIVNPTTSTSWNIPVKTDCQFNLWSNWEDTNAPCVASSGVACQYREVRGWQNANSCTDTRSEGPNYTAIQPTGCRVNYPDSGSVVTACTVVNTGMTQTECWYDDEFSNNSAGWKDVASCTSQGGGGGPNFVGPLRECSARAVVVGEPVNVPSCPIGAPPEACQPMWSGWERANSCYATTNDNNNKTPGAVQCRYVDKGENPTDSCTPVAQSTYPNYTVSIPISCRTTWPFAWENVPAGGSCTPATDLMQCRYDAWTQWFEGECPANAVQQDPTPPYTVTQATGCRMDWGAFTDVPGDTCEVQAGVKKCQLVEATPWVNDISYHPANPPAANPLREYRAVPVDPAKNWTPTNVPRASPETPAPSNEPCIENTINGLTTSCQHKVPLPWPNDTATSYQNVAECEAQTASESPLGVNTLCKKNETGPTKATTCTEQPATSANSYKATFCLTGEGTPTPDTLADVAEYYYITDLRDPSLNNCTGGPIVSGGITNTADVCTNTASVPKQRMSTYTLGLGISGVMQYQPDYKDATSGDYYSVYTGVPTDPANGVCSWQEYGNCNWPRPVSDKQTTVDDLWHAAVNGRGTYFSADNPSAMAAGISTALQEVTAKEGSLASVTVSNPRFAEVEATVGISAYQVSFSSGTWTGEVQQYQITESPEGLIKTPGWSARSLLANKPYETRNIYLFDSNATGNLKPFTFNNLSNDEKKFFKMPWINNGYLGKGLSQLCGDPTNPICLPTMDHVAFQGENLVNFLRGDRTNEGAGNDVSKFYRQRAAVLGDIVNSEATYVKKSTWSYADNGYSAFKAGNANRTAMVYVGANDGMLHAFDATTGQETWAYVPRFLLDRLYLLADKNYGGRHRYYVDGTPVMGDVCVNNCGPSDSNPVWKTILVGGVSLGGRGYYALDITDPANPKGLWEFTSANDANLGYTYGNPVITKLTDGTWVVLVTSGYNNVSPGDGKGRLFVLNAETGVPVSAISAGIATSAGSEANPSGLAKISAWADYPDYNNTAKRVYGGDLMGNLWRFDINGIIPPSGREAMALATLKDGSGNAQPITTQPELGMVLNKYPVVFVGTGQLLGLGDTMNTSTQSLYGIKDTLWSSGYGSPRGTGTFVQQDMTNATCPQDHPFCTEGQSIMNVTNNQVDWTVKNGWYVDFPHAGERVNTDITLTRGTLSIVTNLPQTGACVPAGKSFLYMLDYQTGGAIDGTEGMGGLEWADHFSTGGTDIERSDGTLGTIIGGDGAGAGFIKDSDKWENPRGEKERRISWRGLIVE